MINIAICIKEIWSIVTSLCGDTHIPSTFLFLILHGLIPRQNRTYWAMSNIELAQCKGKRWMQIASNCLDAESADQ